MKVSILIPCYNSEKWVGEAIESALAQTWKDKEVIVVDDGSDDRSLEIINSFGDSIRSESNPNRGSNPTRNRLLDLSCGEWLQYLDADDTLLDTKVEEQAQKISADVDVVFSPTQWVTFDEQARETDRRVSTIPTDRDPWELLIRWQLPQTGGSLWRRSAILDVGGWNEDQPCCQEHELYLRLLSARKKFVFHPQASSIYRQWSEDTLCRSDPQRTILRRMEVVDRCEEFLSTNSELDSANRDAIAATRYECARSIYAYDRRAARQLAKKAKQAHPDFRLPVDTPFPRLYRMLFGILGFAATETIASLARPLSNNSRPR